MLLDFLANIRQFRAYTFILTCCAALFYWTEIIQVVARQNGETLTDEVKQVHAMEYKDELCEEKFIYSSKANQLCIQVVMC